MADLLSIFPLNGNQETTREFTSKKGIVSKINDAKELPEDVFPVSVKLTDQYQQKDLRADPKVSRNFYIAVTQQVLLFGAETWVLTKRMEAALDVFQGRVARRLTGRMPRRRRDGKWLYLPLAGATKEAGIVRARTSVLRRQNMVAQFVVTRPILVLCEGTERQEGTWVPKDCGNSPGSTGGWRGSRKNERRRRETHTRMQLQGRQQRRRRHQDRERERGRRRHWGPVAPVGRNGAGERIKAYSFRRPEIHGENNKAN